jgi:hypothetical protein
VQDHVQLGDRPGGAVVLLAEQREVASVLVGAVLGDVLACVDEHAAGAAARVVHPHSLARVDQADHHPHHGARGVELAALLPRRVGELGD